MTSMYCNKTDARAYHAHNSGSLRDAYFMYTITKTRAAKRHTLQVYTFLRFFFFAFFPFLSIHRFFFIVFVPLTFLIWPCFCLFIFPFNFFFVTAVFAKYAIMNITLLTTRPLRVGWIACPRACVCVWGGGLDEFVACLINNRKPCDDTRISNRAPSLCFVCHDFAIY